MSRPLAPSNCSERVDPEGLRRDHPIAEVVTSYGIELRPSGRALVGRCPFHQDRGRPNLHVYQTSARWICYRCDERGDVIRFVQRIENVPFRDTVARLAGRSSDAIHSRGPIALTKVPPKRSGYLVWGESELQVLAAAADLYANQLLTSHSALAYMAQRGFPLELLRRYRVGYAAGCELVPYLRWRRLSLATAVRVGLLTHDRREFLAGRIIFPEFRSGRPVWMIGRIIDRPDAPPVEVPRYLGLAHCKPLLGWDEAARDLRGVCLVEGPTDLLTLRYWGVPGVALAGTGASADHLSQLQRFGRVYLVLDQDVAGAKAVERLVALLGTGAIRVHLPPGVKDVADLAKIESGAEVFRAAILSATLEGGGVQTLSYETDQTLERVA